MVTAPDDATSDAIQQYVTQSIGSVGDPQLAHLSIDNLRGSAVGLPPNHPITRELERRSKALVSQPQLGAEPSDFDVLARNQVHRDYQAKRGLGERVKDTAAFVASVPVRAMTRGQYGAGDIVGAVSPSGGAAITAGERDFSRANPDLLWTLGAAGELAGGLAPGMAVRARNVPNPATEAAALRATQVADDVAAAQRLNVNVPGFAYNSGPTASVAKQLSDTPIIGAPARNAIQRSLVDIGRAADETAGLYGDARTTQQIGQAAEQGLTRFRDARPADILDDAARNLTDVQISDAVRAPARDTSLKSKQSVLYERAWRNIPEEMRQGRAIEGESRVMGAPAQTRGVLQEIVDRNARMTVQADGAPRAALMPVQGGLLGRMMEAIDNRRWTANLQTLRDMRSEIRRLASGMADTERNVLRHSDLERLQGALTGDMIGLLQRNADAARRAGNEERAAGFERSIHQFRQADRFTRLSAERLDTVERMFNAPNAEALARSIMQAALNRGRGNLEALRTVDRVLRPEEMSQIASGLIREMGTPTGSARGAAQNAGFSVQSFITRWQNMTPEARNIFFRGEHRAAINDLVSVANRMANVEALTNSSRSGTNTLNVGSVLAAGGAVATGAVDTITAGLGSAATGFTVAYLMSRPEYARWMAGYLRLRANQARAADARPVALREHVRRLGAYADQDPNLSEFYDSIRREVSNGRR